jgi:superfamily II DNA or RNA helicase
MAGLVTIDEIVEFADVKDVDAGSVTNKVRHAVASLHEVDDLEEFLRSIFRDLAATPHGPAEIVDILTHKVQVDSSKGLAAFILKGRSFPTVRPKHVAHQIYRLEKISGLKLAVLGTTGVVLDAAKEQFASTCERLGISYCLADTDDLARLCIAYGLLCPRDGSKINGARCHCGYSPGSAALNLLQTDALDALADDRASGSSKGLIVLPTGSGKTRVAALDACNSGSQSVLYIAHTHEILNVAEAEFGATFGSDAVCRSDTTKAKTAPIVLATIQHLSRKPATLIGRDFDYVIVDEFHHAAARTYRAAISEIRPTYLLGMTATPFRGDNQDIAKLCGNNVVVHRDLRSGIDKGILSPYHYFGCFDETDYSGLEQSATGYSTRDLEKRLFVPERHSAIVEKWSERAAGKPTLAFCCSRLHAERMTQVFCAAGIPAATYLANTGHDQRKEMVERLRLGDLKVLCSVDVLNEGADIPFVECLLFLRPTESKRIFIQQLGRGLRRYTGKKQCTVIDFIGNFRNAEKVVEYHDLRTTDEPRSAPTDEHTLRDFLDLPLNCAVTFEDRVLDIFADQSLNPRHADRTNIGRILIHRYRRLSHRLGRPATRKDVDRNEVLDSRFYKMVFRSWDRFTQIVQNSFPGENV